MWPAIAAISGYFLSKSALAKFLGLGILVLPHEFGHAFAAWAGSTPAVPTLLFQTFALDRMSPVFGALYFLVLAYCLIRSLRKGCEFLAFLCLGLITLSVKLTFFSTHHQRAHAFVIGGIAGHLILCGIFVSSFFYKVSEHPSWRINRYVLLFWGFFGLFYGLETWVGTSHNLELLPLGSVWGGSGDENGDIQRLLSEFGWSPQGIARKMSHLCLSIFGAITIQYVFFLKKEWSGGRLASASEPGDSE